MRNSSLTTLLILCLLLHPLIAHADPACYESGLKQYQEALRKPYEDIEKPDTSGLAGCAAAIGALSSITASFSLVTINLGAILNAIIQAAISGLCQFVDGKVKNAVGAVNGAIAGVNAGMEDLRRQQDIVLHQVNRTNATEFLNWQQNVGVGSQANQ